MNNLHEQTCGFGLRVQSRKEPDKPKFRIKRTKRPDTEADHCKKQADNTYKCYYQYSGKQSKFGKQYCKGGKKPVPVNKKLYNSIKNQVKREVKAKKKKWPGRWASYQVVRKYKKEGGKYRCQFGGTLESFYQKGSSNHTNLTPGIRNCETIVYGPKILRGRTMFGVDDCNGKEKSECLYTKGCSYSSGAIEKSKRRHSKNYRVVNGILVRTPDYYRPPPPPSVRIPGRRLGGFGKTNVLTREINYLNKL